VAAGTSFHSIELTAVTLQQADCVVIVTNHASYDWDFITDHAGLIVDSRNAIQGKRKSRIVRL
jgi:UDP-N-acetyl-D-glucosamine dehydrogenase